MVKNSRNLKSVLIIGNGFDLALGYKTSYQNFMDLLIETKSNDFDSYYQFLQEKWSLTNPNIDLAKKFYDFARMQVDNNFVIKYFMDYTEKSLSWANFEKEIENIGHCLESIIIALKGDYKPITNNSIELPLEGDLLYYSNYLPFLKENELFDIYDLYSDMGKITFHIKSTIKVELKICLQQFIKNLPKIFLEKIANFSLLFEKYLRLESTRVISKKYPKTKFDEIITYNYTDFCNNLCKNIFHVNGEVSKSENDFGIIFGVDSDTNFRTNIFNTITKKIQRPAQNIKTNSISDICNDVNYLYIFGHSSDIADKDSLKLALNEVNTAKTYRKIFIYYKSSGSLKNDKLEKIKLTNNLNKILDEKYDNLINIVEFIESEKFFVEY